VTLSVVDSNGNSRVIGTTTSDASGTFAYTWTPYISGNYTITATVSDPKQKKFANAASCTASFTVKQPQPPVVGCSVTPTTVHPGDPVTITAQSSSPDSSKIANRNFSASAGSVKEGETTAGSQPGQSSTVATLDTSGVQPGPVNVTIGVTDVHGQTGTCIASANVEALPITVVSERLISECSFENERKLARVDNECKAILDEAALELQHEPNGRLVVVGFAEEEEEIKVSDVESLRSVNAKSYLTGGEAKQQIDPTRVEARKSSDRGNGKAAKLYFVPEGGTFTVQDTIVVDETALPADRTGVPRKQKAAQPTSSAISGQ